MHQLDRHGALEHRVEGAVDGRHAAPPDHRLEPVSPADRFTQDRHLAFPAPRLSARGVRARRIRRRQHHAVGRERRQPRARASRRRRTSGGARERRAERAERPRRERPAQPPRHPLRAAGARPCSRLAPANTGSATAHDSRQRRRRARNPAARAADSAAPLRETPGTSAAACASPSASPSSGPACAQERARAGEPLAGAPSAAAIASAAPIARAPSSRPAAIAAGPSEPAARS